MIRGISFQIPNEHGSHIGKILEGIHIESYIWKIVDDEVILNIDDDLFSTEILKGDELKRIICNPSYYMVFLNMQAFSAEGDTDTITTFSDFIKSNCEIVLLVCDCIFVDIYVKSKENVEIIKLNAERYKYEKIQYITAENDKSVGTFAY